MVTSDNWKAFLSPTPVALVVVSDGEYVNVAPGTWLQKVSYDPPIVMVSRKLGSDTDRLLTRRLDRKGGLPFVLSLPPQGYEEDVLLCSRTLPFGESELTQPGVRFRIAHRDGNLVFLAPMLAHAVCTVIDPIITVGDHRVFFAEVTDLRAVHPTLDDYALGRVDPDIEPLTPSSVLLHLTRKVFAEVGELIECRGFRGDGPWRSAGQPEDDEMPG